MFYIRPGGHNWGAIINDDLSKVHLAVISVWSACVFPALGLIIYNRHQAFVRMRKLKLLIPAVLALHLYLIMVFLVYPLNGLFICEAEFWIMSLLLPAGIALFHAENMLLYSLSHIQRNLIWHDEAYYGERARRLRSKNGLALLWEKFLQKDAYHRTLDLMYVGLGVQFAISLVIYCASRKFHGWGLTGHAVSAGECRRGWEWAPSIVWQFSWSYVFGPCVLWQIRAVEDIHYWKIQTIMTVVASLIGSPLWLLAVYSGKLANVSKYWVAPMWFAPGIITMEFVTLFFPLLEVYQRREYRRSLQGPLIPTVSRTASSTAASRRTNAVAGMKELQLALRTPSHPIFDFAAKKDFTLENLLFLVDVAEFKAEWDQTRQREGETFTADSQNQLFKKGVLIHANYICMRLSEMPINISGRHRNSIENVFGQASKALQRPAVNDSVTPYDSDDRSNALSMATFNQRPAGADLRSDSQELIISPVVSPPANTALTILPQIDEIPSTFDMTVFDAAEEEIQRTVLNNTWNRYLDYCETTSMTSSDGGKSLSSSKSFLSYEWTKL